MASAYSIARTYNEFVPPLDLELFYKGLQAKQTAYDQNFAFIQTQIDAAKSLDIIKSSDQKYAAERLGQIVEQVNNYGNIDLTSSSVARQVSSHVKQVLDDNVKNAVASTKEYRTFTQKMEELKKTNKAAYNQINEAYALRGFRNYLENDEVGERLGSINYSEYRDVQGKMNKLVMDAFKEYGVTETQSMTSDPWTFLETKVQGIEKEKIRQFVFSNLDAADREQLSINGWYNNSLNSEERSSEVMNEYIDKRNEQIDNRIEEIKKVRNNSSATEKKQIDLVLSSLEQQKVQNEERRNTLKSPESVGAFLEMEKMIGGLELMYSEREISRKYTANQVYANKMRYDLDLRKFAFDVQKFETEQKQAGYDKNGNLIFPPADDTQGNNLSNESIIKGWNDIMTESSEITTEANNLIKAAGLTVPDEGTSDTLENKISAILSSKNTTDEQKKKAKELKIKLDENSNKLNVVKTKVGDLLNGYEQKVGKENLLGYIAYQYDNADSDYKKVLEFAFEQAKRDHLKLKPKKNTTPQQGIDNLKNMMGMGANKGANPYLNRDLYEGVGVHRDTKISDVKRHKGKEDLPDIASINKRVSFFTAYPTATEQDYLMTKAYPGTHGTRSTIEWDNRVIELRREEKVLTEQERTELIRNNKERIEKEGFGRLKSLYGLSDEDITLLADDRFKKITNEGRGVDSDYAKYNRRREIEAQIMKGVSDPTKYLLKDIVTSIYGNEYNRGIVLRPKNLGGSDVEQKLRNEVAAYIAGSPEITGSLKEKFDDAKAVSMFPSDIHGNSFYFAQVDTKSKTNKTFKTQNIPLDRLPVSLQQEVIRRKQNAPIESASYKVIDDSENYKQRAELNKVLKTSYTNYEKQYPNESKLDINIVNQMVNNPESFNIYKEGNTLYLGKKAGDQVYTLDTEGMTPYQINNLYTNYVYSSSLINEALLEIITSINNGIIPKNLQK